MSLEPTLSFSLTWLSARWQRRLRERASVADVDLGFGLLFRGQPQLEVWLSLAT